MLRPPPETGWRLEVGHAFTLRTDPQPGFDGIVQCRVLELDPPRRMRWTWRGGPIDTVISFDLETATLADARGTRLVIHHSGFEGLPAVLVSFIMGAGSRTIYGRALPQLLDRLAGRAVAPTRPTGMRAAWRLLTTLFGPILRRAERRKHQ